MLAIKKAMGLTIAETVFNILLNDFDFEDYDVRGFLDTFNNCRETGLILFAYVKKGDKSIDTNVWVCRSRGSDSIMICVGKNHDINNKFDEKQYNHAKYFRYDEIYLAINYIKEYLDNL